MKRIKKFFICLMTLTMLCSSQLIYVSAATEAETEVMASEFPAQQEVTKNGITVTFYFTYSDGNSADCYLVLCDDSNYSMSLPNVSIASDRCYASVVMTHNTTGAQISFRAWCDIYGDTGIAS